MWGVATFSVAMKIMADFFTSFMFKLVMYKMGGGNEAAFSDDEHHRECFHGGGTWRERSLL